MRSNLANGFHTPEGRHRSGIITRTKEYSRGCYELSTVRSGGLHFRVCTTRTSEDVIVSKAAEAHCVSEHEAS